jgi:predicted secreted protein
MSKIAGKDLVFKLGTAAGTWLATVGIFDPNIDESAGEIEVTDSSSTDKEYLSGYTGRTLTYSKWYAEDSDPDDVGDTRYFSWKAGTKTFSGQLIITGRKIGATREDAHRYDYTARITGALGYA